MSALKIKEIEIYKLSIPMHPFTIATGTMHFAQNIFIRIQTDGGLRGVGECSAFPMIVGETQNTCFAMAKDFASLLKGKDAVSVEERMDELHAFAAFNTTIKSAFDMALFDQKAKAAGIPLFALLGGKKKRLETDVTVGISSPADMAKQATDFVRKGARIIKVKVGKEAAEDITRVKAIQNAVGGDIALRLDANQGWTFEEAKFVLQELGGVNIEFCEQPMRKWNDHLLPALRKSSTVPIMADESVFDHHDAQRLIDADACDYINIKFSKSGGILEALKIAAICSKAGIPCMMGGMLESRLALTAFGHFATATDIVQFYDMDTCLLGHKSDPVTGGIRYEGFELVLPDQPGIGADIDEDFLKQCESVVI